MNVVYKTLNNIQTELITWGNPFNCNGSDVIICVSGNPGVPDFYIEFGSVLYNDTGLPVCIVGQAGHVQVPEAISNILEKRENHYNLKGQLLHKLDLINNHIDKNSKLHLIGHSIGSWMLLEILNSNKDVAGRVSSLQFLFPTIQQMAETRSGKTVNHIFRRIHFLIILLLSIIHLLPEMIKSFLIRIYLKWNSLPPHYADRILKCINPLVMEKVLFLAYDEMDTVRDLNSIALEKVKHKTNVIYGSSDQWAPLSYMDKLKPFKPQLQMKEVNISHAFVLKSSEPVAEMVANFIKA